jgi:hypothetical protein
MCPYEEGTFEAECWWDDYREWCTEVEAEEQ